MEEPEKQEHQSTAFHDWTRDYYLTSDNKYIPSPDVPMRSVPSGLILGSSDVYLFKEISL